MLWRLLDAFVAWQGLYSLPGMILRESEMKGNRNYTFKEFSVVKSQRTGMEEIAVP